MSGKEAKQLEKLWIITLRSYDPEFGYNMTFGGEGVIPTIETRQNQSNAAKGRIVPETTLLNMRSGQKLRRQSFPEMWITDGSLNKRIIKTKIPPTGWWVGYTPSEQFTKAAVTNGKANKGKVAGFALLSEKERHELSIRAANARWH